ncbi:MAG: hypothetical protein IPK59_11970 [Rhodospirillaceae bacterium]|nr:hypothetical protein [Rhodospirillaceae bacterium]
MAGASLLLSTFNAGEWSPELYGRIDLDKYRNACRVIENFVLLAQGPATRRPGTQFIAATKGDDAVRLIPFEFSTEQAYVIEAGEAYFRFYMNGGRIETSPGTAYEIATPYGVADLAGLKWAQSADVLYLTHPNFAPHKLSRSGHTSWTLSEIEFLDGPYLDENIGAISLTPAAAGGSNITLTASADLFAATDVGRLVRIKHSSVWGWARIITFTSATQVKIDIKGAFGGTDAVTNWRLGAWSATTGWPSAVTFHEERLFLANTRAQPQTLWASVSGAYESFAPTGADGIVKDDHGLNFTIADDRVNAIRWMSAGKTLALGTTGGEFNLTASSLNEALTPSNITVRRETTNGSADIRPERIGAAVLYVQRAGRKIYEMAYSFENDAFNSPELSMLARHLTMTGIKEIAFQAEPWSILWVVLQDGGLLGLTYMRGQDVVGWHRHRIAGREARVLSVAVIPGGRQDEAWLAIERRVGGTVKRSVERLAAAFEPRDPFDKQGAFFVDGGLSFDGAGSVALTPGAGAETIGSTGVIFTAAAGIFGPGDVGREIQHLYPASSGEGYYVARAIVTGFTDGTHVTTTIHAAFPSLAAIAAEDWSLGAQVIGGLDHLIGEVVTILADGATHPDRVVAPDGTVTLERAASYAHVGLGYTSRLSTMDIEAGAMDGAAQGKKRRVHRVVVRLHNSLGMRVGADAARTDDVVFRAARTAMDQSPPLFSGDKFVAFPKGWDGQAIVTVLQEQPLPCTIVALIPQLTTMDG